VFRRLPIPFVTIVALILAACSGQPQGGTTSPAPTAAVSPGATVAGEQPKPGGELIYIVSAEPPTFDAHQCTTFACLMPIAPHYSLLYRLDPADNISKIIPDVADGMPQISSDKLTWTIKLKKDIKFHDGSVLTAADVAATYSKIIKPPTGVTSPRQGVYAAVDTVTASDPSTVVFKLKYPSGSFQAALASPWNYLYQESKLKTDPKFYEKNVMGTGPFTHVEYVKGSHWAGKKNPNYFDKGKPYLDSFKAVFITDANRQTTAIQSKQAMIEFRGFTPQQRDTLARALGNDLAIQESPWVCQNYVAFNTTKKPFDDVRVRQALSLAIDRWGGAEALAKQTFVRDVGGLMRAKGPFAMPDSDLEKILGFSRDNKASVEKAKKLLQDAGVPDLKFNFLNRQTSGPYEPLGVFLINEWKKIGVTATHQIKETAAYQADQRTKNFDVTLDFNCDYMDEPDLQLAKFYSVSGLGNGLNFSHYDDKALDGMIDAQSRETDPEKRKKMVWDIERYVMGEKTYYLSTVWWYRILPYLNVVRGYRIGSNHYTTMDMANIWLATK
jgi:peptide/nickel transport system substrate-binding protein